MNTSPDEQSAQAGYFKLPNDLVDRIGERLGPNAAWVYVVLSRHADAEGKCWPTHATIAKKSGLSRATVIRTLASLQASELITVEIGKEDGKPNTYHLCLTIQHRVYQCDTPYATKEEGVSGRDTGCITQQQGVFHPDTPGVSHSNTEEYPSKNTQEKDPKNNTPPTPRKRGNADGGELAAWFDAEFWLRYPRKEGKQQALQELVRLKPDSALRCRILAGLERARGSPQWRRDGGQYIPHAKTWLHNRRWEDEIRPDVPATRNGHSKTVGLDFGLDDAREQNRRWLSESGEHG